MHTRRQHHMLHWKSHINSQKKNRKHSFTHICAKGGFASNPLGVGRSWGWVTSRYDLLPHQLTLHLWYFLMICGAETLVSFHEPRSALHAPHWQKVKRWESPRVKRGQVDVKKFKSHRHFYIQSPMYCLVGLGLGRVGWNPNCKCHRPKGRRNLMCLTTLPAKVKWKERKCDQYDQYFTLRKRKKLAAYRDNCDHSITRSPVVIVSRRIIRNRSILLNFARCLSPISCEQISEKDLKWTYNWYLSKSTPALLFHRDWANANPDNANCIIFFWMWCDWRIKEHTQKYWSYGHRNESKKQQSSELLSNQKIYASRGCWRVIWS